MKGRPHAPLSSRPVGQVSPCCCRGTAKVKSLVTPSTAFALQGNPVLQTTNCADGMHALTHYQPRDVMGCGALRSIMAAPSLASCERLEHQEMATGAVHFDMPGSFASSSGPGGVVSFPVHEVRSNTYGSTWVQSLVRQGLSSATCWGTERRDAVSDF